MLILICLSWLLPFPVAQEAKDKWQRVYTGDDVIIEINILKVTFGEKKIGRVRFRTVLSRPQQVKETPAVQYKSRLEIIEFKCAERQYRIYQTTLLDLKGNVIDSYEGDISEEWKTLKPGGMMQKLFGPACSLIDEKRRRP